MTQDPFLLRRDGLAPDAGALLLNETLFHSANGYLGVRGCYEEGYPEGMPSIRGQYINGFYDIAPLPQAEKLYGLAEEKETLLNVADTQGIRLFAADAPLHCFDASVRGHRVLDMRAGLSVRECAWIAPNGGTLRITIKRMASFGFLPLFTIEYIVRSEDFSGLARGAVFFEDESEGSSTLTVDEGFGHGSGVGVDASDMERLTRHHTRSTRDHTRNAVRGTLTREQYKFW